MKNLIKIVALLVFLFLFLFSGLVLLGSTQECEVKREYPDCSHLRVKYAEEKTSYLVLPKEEGLESITKNRVFEAKREDLKGNNGYSCGDFAYVADDLPSASSRYVKIHEALHLAGETNETKVNWQAARLAPWGMAETVIYTVYSAYKEAPLSRWPCTSKRMWENFKIYFINYG